MVSVFTGAESRTQQFVEIVLNPVKEALRSADPRYLYNNETSFNEERISGLLVTCREYMLKPTTSADNFFAVMTNVMIAEFDCGTWNNLYRTQAFYKIQQDMKKLKNVPTPKKIVKDSPGGGGRAKQAAKKAKRIAASEEEPSSSPTKKIKQGDKSTTPCVFNLRFILKMNGKDCVKGETCNWLHPTLPSTKDEKVAFIELFSSLNDKKLVASMTDKVEKL